MAVWKKRGASVVTLGAAAIMINDYSVVRMEE
jgi:hypothetical protein